MEQVATETTSADTDTIVAELGLVRSFAEHVMRHALAVWPPVSVPHAMSTYPFDHTRAQLFHSAYLHSFADRPGFPAIPMDEWLGDLLEDEQFRAQDSLVALDRAGQALGFVTVLGNWIDQVGVIPSWRSRGLGTHLMTQALQSISRGGHPQAWLTVNTDNSARELYLRLGFVDHGLRARYRAPAFRQEQQ